VSWLTAPLSETVPFGAQIRALLSFVFYLSLILGNFVRQDAMNALAKEERTQFRKRILKTALIVLSDSAPKLECAARDVSAGGAHLYLSTTYGLPNHFDVIIDGKRKSCRSVWRSYTEMGVMFE
jgi:hypothetical protein